jgi:hypothetical protein
MWDAIPVDKRIELLELKVAALTRLVAELLKRTAPLGDM